MTTDLIHGYRQLPRYPAAALAAVISLAVSIACALAVMGFLSPLVRQDGAPAGILVVGFALGFVPFGFVLAFTFLVKIHHANSWRAPTVGLVVCAALIWALGFWNLWSVAAAVLGWLIGMLVLLPKANHGEA